MNDFTIHTAASAPDGSRDALAALEQNIGFIPNLAATIAGSPVAIGRLRRACSRRCAARP